MSVAWQKMPFLAPSKGLLRRAGTQIDDPYFAQTAMNLEYLGGIVAKRYGTKLVNGAVAIAQTGSTASVLKVVNSALFTPTETVQVYENPLASGAGNAITIDTIPDGTTLTLLFPLTFTPIAGTTVIVARRAMPARVDALASVTFRDGVQRLLASSSGLLYVINTTAHLAALVGTSLPATTTGAGWTTTTGPLTSVQGLQVGDWIQIPSVTAPKIQRVSSIVGTTVTVAVAFGSAPGTSVAVTFFPSPTAGDSHFLQYANVTHIASIQPAGAPTTVAPIPPTKYPESGNAVQRHGIKPPVTAPNILSLTGTGITGAYRYRLTFRNSVTGQESEGSPESGTANPGNKTVNLDTLAVSVDPQVDKKRLYRTTAGGDGVWFFLAEITNATVAYSDATPDTTLSTTQLREFLDVTIPDTVSVIALWPQANRLVAIDGVNRVVDPVTGVESINGGIVRFSDQPDTATGRLKGESWPADNTIFIDYDDGDALVGIAAFYDALIVFKQRSIWRVIGIPPNLTIEPLNFRSDLTSIGALNQKSIVVDENEMLFASYDGVYVIDRYAGVQTGFQANRLSRPIEDTWLTFMTQFRRKAHGVYFRDRRQYRVWIPFSDNPPLVVSSEFMSRALLYQFDSDLEGKEGGWSEWVLRQLVLDSGAGFTDNQDVTASCVAQQVATSGPDLVYVGTADGLVMQLDATDVQGDFTGIVPYQMNYITLNVAPAGAGMPARARAIDLVIQQASGATGGVVTIAIIPEFATQVIAGVTQTLSAVLTQSARSIVLTRGMKMAIRFTEISGLPRIQLLQGELWFQPLPVAAKVVDALQSAVTYAVGV